MRATPSYVRNFLLSQAYRWAWRDPAVFQRLIDEDETALDRAVTLWRLVPDDLNPEETCALIHSLYQALTEGPKTLDDLCKHFGWAFDKSSPEKLRAHRAAGILVLGNMVTYNESSQTYSSAGEPNPSALEFYVNTYRNDCLGRHVCG